MDRTGERDTREERDVAVVGLGPWGRNLARVLHGLSALRAGVDRDPEARAAFSRTFGLPAFSTTEEVLDDARVRGVVIATPAESHHALARQALLAGRDVLVEKPFTLSVRDAEDLAALSDRLGRVLLVGHLLLYHPAIVALRDLVARGDLGEILYVYSSRLNLGRVRSGENILWSFAPHDIAILLHLLEALPDSVAAHAGSWLQPGVADVTVSHLVFPGSARAHIFVSWLHPYKDQTLVVVGRRRMASFHNSREPAELLLHDRGVDLVNGIPRLRGTGGEPIALADVEPLHVECLHFLNCMDARTTPLTDGWNGVRVLRVIEACQASLDRGGVPVPLAPGGAA